MARVLLINPSYVPSYSGAVSAIANPVFPTLGLAAIAASAMQFNHKVEILDLSYTPYSFSLVAQTIDRFKPDIVGVTATTPLMNQLRDISVLIKEKFPSVKVVGGGAHISALPRESMLESKLDVAFVGEADISFAEYCNGVDLQKIKGIYYRDDNEEIVSTGDRQPIANLDDLPLPAWELYDKEIYRIHGSRLFARNLPVVGVEFSRGCVYKCDYCASKMTMALGYRKKSPQRCAAELKKLKELGFREAVLVDDIFTSDQEWASQVCDAIIESKVSMPWSCTNGIRVESAKKDLFEKMRKAGCYRVSFGFESGNDEILKAFGKGGKASIAKGKEAAVLASKAGLETSGFFMIGLTADTEQSIMDTINYAKQLPLHMMKFGRTVAFPGTQMFNRYHTQGIICSYDWDNYFTYSNESIFTHEHLSRQTIERYTKLAYKRALLFNPAFIVRRVLHSIKTGRIFLDIVYSLKLYKSKPLANTASSYYYARERWPVYSFDRQPVSRTKYSVVHKTKMDQFQVIAVKEL